jgi:hypothetical protein
VGLSKVTTQAKPVDLAVVVPTFNEACGDSAVGALHGLGLRGAPGTGYPDPISANPGRADRLVALHPDFKRLKSLPPAPHSCLGPRERPCHEVRYHHQVRAQR